MILNAGAYVADYGPAFTIGPAGNGINVGTATYFQYNGVLINNPSFGSSCIAASTGSIYVIGLQCILTGNTVDVAVQVTGAGRSYVSGSVIGGGATGSAMSGGVGGFAQEGPANGYTANPRFSGTAGSFIPQRVVNGSCTGTVTALLTTGGLYGTGGQATPTTTTCTLTTPGAGIPMDHAGTLYVLQVLAGTAGTNSSSGAFTVLKNGVTTALTCTVGTGTSCLDGTHTVSFVAGDLISIEYTSQAADTLANIKASVGAY
jgi:hypothetical protein